MSSSQAAEAGEASARRKLPDDVPSLGEFMRKSVQAPGAGTGRVRPEGEEPVLVNGVGQAGMGLDGLNFFVETYGCQMNVADSEVVQAVLQGTGMQQAENADAADVVLINTCAVRENAETKVWERLKHLRAKRRGGKSNRGGAVGLLGCMAERLKSKLLEEDRLVDFVAGPDAYRDLPRLVQAVQRGDQAINVQLSLEETYADIAPVRTHGGGVAAFLSIMRGCNNMCSYCVVPFTRGRERSRALDSIVDEVRALADQGFKEVTLLGQNVNSYWDRSAANGSKYETATGFSNLYKIRDGHGARFVDLLEAVSRAAPGVRFRFTSPHPKDFPSAVLQLIAERPNLCSQLHIPAQSGSSSVLERMRRGYSREAYDLLLAEARATIPGLAISTDMISGFCGESEAEHADTLSLMAAARFEQAYMFAYSERSHTHASHRMADDVPEHTKLRRLQEVINTFRAGAAERAADEAGRRHVVLVEGPSKRSTAERPQLTGRADNNKMCVFDAAPVPDGLGGLRVPAPGDWVAVSVASANAATLHVTPECLQSGP